MVKPKFYITTPIYYVNDLPHIGHAYTTIACDVLARFKKLAGHDVFFLTGTDEHGQKIERRASQCGQDPKTYCDTIASSFRDLWAKLDIDYDHFIRTTDEYHKSAVQDIFTRLYDSGDIYKGEYSGWYCTPCETFWLETQLIEGSCPDCHRKVELLKEESYFFRLSKYAGRLLEHIEMNPDFIQPSTRKNEMVNFIKSGLEDLCVSRTTFKWGVPVPFDQGHVVYVWVDALTNYITALGYPTLGGNFARYWPADVHVMGKEIVRFHTIIWPAILMSLGLPLPNKVFGHGWWTVEGEKMSKSKGNVVDPAAYAEEFGIDALRYFVLREVPFGQDGDFSKASFIHRVNADLANDLGNMLSRCTAMINKFCDGKVPASDHFEDIDREIPSLAVEVCKNYERHMNSLAFQDALAEIFRLVGRGNKYIDEAAPWTLAKTEDGRRRLGTVLYNVAESLRIAAIALSPVLTRNAVEIWRQLGLEGRPEEAGWAGVAWGGLRAGTTVRRGDPVFPRFDAKTLLAEAPSKSEAKQEANGDACDGLISIHEFARVELRVATVLAAENVKGSDKLVRIQVDVGTETRQVVAGIGKHYQPGDLVGKQVIVVANLQPAKLKGEISQGMLLAATSGNELRLLTLDGPAVPGSKVK